MESSNTIKLSSIPAKIKDGTAETQELPETENAVIDFNGIRDSVLDEGNDENTSEFQFTFATREDGRVKLDFQRAKDSFEKEFIIQALVLNMGKINQTALNANIPKKTLLRKIEKYEINPKDYY